MKKCWGARNKNSSISDKIVALICARVTEIFERGNARVRMCIETGFLEHVFETPELRGCFLFWDDNPQLSDAFRNALAWGQDHKPVHLFNLFNTREPGETDGRGGDGGADGPGPL